MSSIFAPFYESLLRLYADQYRLIFNELYNGPGYFVLGSLLLFLPGIIMALFYFDHKLWYRNPYWGWKTWAIWLVVSAAITAILTYVFSYQFIFGTDNQALNDALNNQNLKYNDYANYLVWMYVLVNGIGALVTGVIHSLWLRLFSKLHIHIPF